ncbi:uncharacterized protein ASPGLDRAFT_311553 [Aspergillus glaucus CBS 516.65]|uniref:Uncharacterized protein n=1 Tax=Aspergillus glaucus CBS 516.65 TaxID=1160497 RepID=A0A1L9VK07_ASPGL|nr:hypothetical protein ASPGLDRAFT_311553 [Aspergillus glaucus CBS 516.65]OJJ84258.1 hypothetical protein ASPGLDRAFT_311553 [Aspergillus glaucus CBS 516.65]
MKRTILPFTTIQQLMRPWTHRALLLYPLPPVFHLLISLCILLNERMQDEEGPRAIFYTGQSSLASIHPHHLASSPLLLHPLHRWRIILLFLLHTHLRPLRLSLIPQKSQSSLTGMRIC